MVGVHVDAPNGVHLMGPTPVDINLPVREAEDLLPVTNELAGVCDGLDCQRQLILGIVGRTRSLALP